MSGREWQPGDVAMVAAYNRPQYYRAYFDGKTWREHGHDMFCVDEPTNIRPLVVIDTEFPRTVVKHLRAAADANPALTTLLWLADQIEEQTEPPKPDEPTGLGAVVEDAEGERWVRVNRRTGTQEWRCCDFNGEFRNYDAIAAVRVLSEGVTP